MAGRCGKPMIFNLGYTIPTKTTKLLIRAVAAVFVCLTQGSLRQ